MSPCILGIKCETAEGFRTLAYYMRRDPVDLNDHLLKAKCSLIETYANYLEAKASVAARRRDTLTCLGFGTPSGLLLESANLLLLSYEQDLECIEGILRAAEKVAESYVTTTFVESTVRDYRELLGRLRTQAQDRLDRIDFALLQDIRTQYAVQNLVP